MLISYTSCVMKDTDVSSHVLPRFVKIIISDPDVDLPEQMLRKTGRLTRLDEEIMGEERV